MNKLTSTDKITETTQNPILELANGGLTTNAIAKKLNISVKSVNSFWICKKMLLGAQVQQSVRL